MFFKCINIKTTLKWNSNVSKVKTLCGATSTNGERAKCDTCGTNFSCEGGSTESMRNHLHLKHQIQVESKTKAHVLLWQSVLQVKPRLTTFLDQSKSRRIVAELAAVDRTSSYTITTSRQMRHAFLTRGYRF